MNFKNNNCEGTPTNVIEIVSSNTELELLKRSGNENIIVCLPLSLCIGKLNNTTPFNRNVLNEYDKNEKYNFTDDFEKLTQITKNCKKIRVWSSHLDCNDYCLLLFICYLYPDKEISAIFCEEINWAATTLSAIFEKEILELENREHILTKWQKEDYKNEWVKVVKSNKELRYMLNGTVISCNFDKFNKEIMNRLKKTGEICIYKFIADLMGNPIIPYVFYSDWIYVYLIERLEKKGKIKSCIMNGKKYIKLA